MTRLSAWRLIPLSTVIVAGALLALMLFVSAVFFNTYIGSLRHDSETLLDETANALTKNHVRTNALTAAHVVIPTFFRRSLLMTLIDDNHRVTVFYRRAAQRHAEPAVVVRDRDDRSGEPGANGGFARIVLGLAAIDGLEVERAHVGRIDIYVKDNDYELVSDIRAYMPEAFLTLFAILGVAYLTGKILNRHALRPLMEVTVALENLAVGDFTPQFVTLNSRGDLGRLTVAYNGAVAQVKSALEQRDRSSAAMRQFISDAGHQLRTPLTVIRGFIAILSSDDEASQERVHSLKVMHQQSVLMGSLIDNLILLDRWEQPQVSRGVAQVDIMQLVQDIVGSLGDVHPSRVLTLSGVHTGEAFAEIDPHELTFAITNLVDNALKYTTGQIAVIVEVRESNVLLTVSDEGPGMNEDAAAHAFDRFFRGDRRDIDGSGLGLSIARKAVERAHGHISLLTTVEDGSQITIQLPRSSIS